MIAGYFHTILPVPYYPMPTDTPIPALAAMLDEDERHILATHGLAAHDLLMMDCPEEPALQQVWRRVTQLRLYGVIERRRFAECVLEVRTGTVVTEVNAATLRSRLTKPTPAGAELALVQRVLAQGDSTAFKPCGLCHGIRGACHTNRACQHRA